MQSGTLGRPSRKESLEIGLTKDVDKAVAIPPEYLEAFEECLRRMCVAQDWRCIALAASLGVAYSLTRVAHMNRSTFISTSPVVYWLEAFRGKGNRQGIRKPFKWAMTRHGLSGFDVGHVIFEAWDEWSKRRVLPLDYIVLDPSTGAMMDGSHVGGVIRAVAAGFLPTVFDGVLVKTYGFRRFGTTLAQITKTPAQDLVALGGWAGGPELAKLMTESSELLTAWKRSMPHLYADMRNRGGRT